MDIYRSLMAAFGFDLLNYAFKPIIHLQETAVLSFKTKVILKKLLLILFFGSPFCNAQQIIPISDINFKNALVNTICIDTNNDFILDSDADINNDGEIDMSEAAAVIRLDISDSDIYNTNGLIHFTNLISLYCQNNHIQYLDLGSSLDYLNCSNNELSGTLIFNGWYLICNNNYLTEILLNDAPYLKYLYASNNELSAISNLEFQYFLEILDIDFNQVTDLNLEANFNLRELKCAFNAIETLDLSSHPDLEVLGCRDNQLTELDFRNGTNTIATYFSAINNPDLTCIYVDDSSYSETNWLNIEEPSAFVETEATCALLTSKEHNALVFSVYPTPTKDVVHIQSKTAIKEVAVYTTLGQRLLSAKAANQVDLSHLASGVYFLNIEAVDGTSGIKRILKD